MAPPENPQERLAFKALTSTNIQEKMSSEVLTEVNTQEELDEYLKSAGDRLVIIYFTAPWCGPCRLSAPSLKAIAREEPDILFLKVDGSELEGASEKYEIRVMPTFCFIKNGEKLETYIGGKLDNFKETLTRMKAQHGSSPSVPPTQDPPQETK